MSMLLVSVSVVCLFRMISLCRLSVCLSYLSVLPACLVCLSVLPVCPACLYVLPACPSVRPSVCLPVLPACPARPSVRPSVCSSCLSCLPACLPACSRHLTFDSLYCLIVASFTCSWPPSSRCLSRSGLWPVDLHTTNTLISNSKVVTPQKTVRCLSYCHT